MPEDKAPKPETPSVGDKFPALKPLEEQVERAKLHQALAETRAATTKAQMPDLDAELGKDTATVGDKSTGLARVLVQMDSMALADDLADLALDAARSSTDEVDGRRTYVLRVVNDREFLGDIDVHQLIEGRCDNLAARLVSLAPEEKGTAGGTKPRRFLAPAVVLGVGLKAVGLATKLLSHDYQLSGREVPTDDLGLDLQVAHWLTAKARQDEVVEVQVERLLPTRPSKIAAAVWKLAGDCSERLAPTVGLAAGELTEAAVLTAADEKAIAALDEEILELVKRVPEESSARTPTNVASLLDELTKRRQELSEGIGTREAKLASTRDLHDRGAELLHEIEDFVTAAVTASESGGRPPLVRASRAEAVASPEAAQRISHIVYARLIAGGIDETVDTRLGSDRWGAVAGVTAEFAVLTADGRLLESGVRSTLQASSMTLGKPESFSQDRLGYPGLERRREE